MDMQNNCGRWPPMPPVDPGQQVLAMSYVPDQRCENVYQLEYGFVRGTIFADLDKPWIGGRVNG